jgi:ribosomal protein S11
MIKFYWQGIVISQEGILEIRGVHDSIDKSTAEKELSECGIRILEIREATSIDLQIERLKKLKRNIILSKNKKG